MRSFAADTDFHGVRHMVRPEYGRVRRLSWAFVWVVCLAGFSIFCYLRIEQFLAYPYSTEFTTTVEEIFLPGVALCTSSPFDVFDPQDLADEERVTDEEFLLHMSYRKRGSVTLDFLDIDSSQTASVNYDKMISQAKDYFNKGGAIYNRLLNLPRGITFNLNTEVKDYFAKYGMSRRFLKSWEHGVEDGPKFLEDYTPHIREELTDEGQCLIIDPRQQPSLKKFQVNEQQRAFSNEMMRINLVLDDPCCRAKTLAFVLYDKQYGTFLSANKRRSRLELAAGHRHEISISEIRVERRLPHPYHHVHCTEDRAGCIQRCITDTLNCSLIIGAHGGGKRLCYFKNFQRREFTETKLACDQTCLPSCQNVNIIDAVSSEPQGDGSEPKWRIHLQLSRSASYEDKREQPLYPVGSLLAELGGTLGLFLGASVLSLVHVVECLCLGVTQVLTCRKDGTQPVKI